MNNLMESPSNTNLNNVHLLDKDSGVGNNKSDSTLDFSALLLKKTQECELAAQLGQMLVQENEKLKEYIVKLETGPSVALAAEPVESPNSKATPTKSESTPVVDAAFSDEIQLALLEQSRKLSLKWQEEKDLRLDLESKLAAANDQLSIAKGKYASLKQKNNVLVNEKWQQTQRIQDLEAEIEDLITAQASASKAHIDACIKEEQSPDSSSDSSNGKPAKYLKDLQQILLSKIDIPEPNLDLNQLPLPLKSECDLCIEMQSALQKITGEKAELELLLNKAQESLEKFQSESLMVDGGLDHPEDTSNLNNHMLSLLVDEKDFQEKPINSSLDDQMSFAFGSDLDLSLNLGRNNEDDQVVVRNSEDDQVEQLPNTLLEDQIPLDDNVETRKQAFKFSFSEAQSIHLTKEKQPPVECLTFTMIGSWFQKFNRFNRKPQLRYCWVNPYEQTINWANHPPSEGNYGKIKRARIVAIQWRDSPISQNYPPSSLNCITIITGDRIIQLQPVSWEIHDQWVSGISFLLKRTRSRVPTEAQFEMVQKYQAIRGGAYDDDDGSGSDEETSEHTPTARHRRLHTSFANGPRHSAVVDQVAARPSPFRAVLSTPKKLLKKLLK